MSTNCCDNPCLVSMTEPYHNVSSDGSHAMFATLRYRVCLNCWNKVWNRK